MIALFAVEEAARMLWSWTTVVAVAGLIGMAIGGTIVWIVHVFTIRKLRLEIKQIEGGQITKLHEYRNKYREADREVGQSMKAFFMELDTQPTNPGELHSARENVCAALDEAIPRYVELFEFECHIYRGDQSRMKSLIDSATWDLRMWGRCLTSINRPKVLRFLRRQPMKINKRTLHSLRTACDSGQINVEDSSTVLDLSFVYVQWR